MATTWQSHLKENFDTHVEELKDYLRIPSVSALPDHQDDVRRAADWVAEKLRDAGVPVVEMLETERNPIVFGHWHVDDDQPTVLIYGHYDVQPPDPLGLWETPPFDPQVRDGRLYARGASDDKGNSYATVKAIEALARTEGKPPVNVKIFFEGEEEIGSPSMPVAIRKYKDTLACDYVLSADGSMYGPDQPSVTVSSKGVAACEVHLKTAATDLHSGLFGATVPNAARAIARLASTLHDDQNRVAVTGFYDRVRELTPDERDEIARVPFDEAELRRVAGVTDLVGEEGWSPLERMWTRPTLDINGIWGGFQGAGVKTVTPNEAHIKITCRLVPDQDPAEIVGLIRAHVEMHCPPGATVTVEGGSGRAIPFNVSRDNPALAVAAEVLHEMYGKEPIIERSGGTIPVAQTFKQELGTDMIFFSWGLPENGGHAPNESHRLVDFDRAREGYCRILHALERHRE